ncbi:MAG: hypothetical protein QNI92_08705 [Desulfobacterales bacterium]|nr:hypothetical protein [Desulfobacterales bacterium]
MVYSLIVAVNLDSNTTGFGVNDEPQSDAEQVLLVLLALREKPQNNLEQILADMQQQLNLTDAQVEQVRPILRVQSQKRKELFDKYRSQGRQGRSAIHSEMQTLRAETEAQLVAILSNDQMQAYRNMQDQRRERMQPRFRSGGSRRSG